MKTQVCQMGVNILKGWGAILKGVVHAVKDIVYILSIMMLSYPPQPEHMGLVIKGWKQLISPMNPQPSCRIFASHPGFLELCFLEDLGPQRGAAHQGILTYVQGSR